MAKLNTKTRTVKPPTSPIRTASAVPDTVTHEGGPGYTRDDRSALFLLAVNHLAGEDTFYEKGEVRDQRLVGLVRGAAVQDAEWTAGFLHWLRNDANMRTVSIIAAAEAAHAMVAAGVPGGRGIIASVLQRGDEPGELVAYWRSRFGTVMPMPVKKGINDAIRARWTQHAVLRYDTPAHSVRFGDVLSLTHPTPATPQQAALFAYILHRAGVQRGRAYREVSLEELPMVDAQQAFYDRVRAGDPSPLTDRDLIRAAGLNPEDVLPLNGSLPTGVRVAPGVLWDALIPTMGYMALLRNLRAFDEAGISAESAVRVASRLADPAQVARSRQFPYRFASAFREVSSVRWHQPLEDALTLSAANIPELPGRTLVLVDTSASMTNSPVSSRSKATPVDIAALFGAALAVRNPGRVDLFGFADPRPFRHHVRVGSSILATAKALTARVGEAGHGTDIAGSLAATFHHHHRVIVISDMQTVSSRLGSTTGMVPSTVPMYGFNLGGYGAAAMPSGSGNRYELGGITDHTFRQIPLLEAGRSATWPWVDAPRIDG